MMRKFILLTLFIGLTACGGGGGSDSSNENDGGGEVLPKSTIQGTVAEGLAIDGAVVTFTDQNGNSVTTISEVMTDSLGQYTANFNGDFPLPLVVSINASGKSLKTIVDDAEQTTVNVNPVTNFVAKKVLAEIGIENVTSGTFELEGGEVVEASFGEGVDFSAFSSKEFVAKNADNTTEPSPADVILDALADDNEDSGVDAILDTAITANEPLFEQKKFQVKIAKAATKTTVNAPLSSLLKSSEGSTSASINHINDFTTVIKVKKEKLNEDLADRGLSDKKQQIIIDELVDMASELIGDASDDITTDDLEQLLDNTDDLFTEDLVSAVENTDEGISDDDLSDTLGDVSEQIIVIIEDYELDFTSPESVELPSEIIEIIGEIITRPGHIVKNKQWNQSNWDELVWQ